MSGEQSDPTKEKTPYHGTVPQHQSHYKEKEENATTEEILAESRRLREERKNKTEQVPTNQVEHNRLDIISLQEEMEMLKQDLENLGNTMEEIRCAKVEPTPSSSRGSVRDLFSPKKEDMEQLKALVEKQAITISRLEKQIEALKSEVNQSSGALRPTVEPFLKLGSAVQACPSTKELIEPYLPLENTKNVVLFVGLVGNERTFAQVIYNAMKKYKSTEKTAITPSEKALFVAVNDFYKKRDDIEFDVLVLPEESGKFNKLQLQDLEKPGNTAFRQYTEVYVPIVMKDEKSVGFRGVVKGKS